MTMIGNANLVARLASAAIGLVEKAPPASVRRATWVIAHRGAARVEVENTVAAFARAVELGADAVEADVCVTRDGAFVLWHDHDPNETVALARQTVAEGSEHYARVLADVDSRRRVPVCELTLEELRADYGYVRKNPDGSDGERVGIPLLEELFAWAEGEPRVSQLFLDVKLQPGETEAARRLLFELRARVARFREGLTVRYLSTQEEVLDALALDAAHVPLPPGLVLTPDFELPGVVENAARLSLRDVSMGCGQRLWSGFRHELYDVVKARDAGELRSVAVWTMNGEEELSELLDLGVDGIVTDDAPLLRRMLGAGQPTAG